MYIIESSLDDNFYLGKNDSSAERAWKLAQATSDQVSRSKGGKSITWSSRVDWNGFPQDISYAKTLEDEKILVSVARDQDLVNVNFKGKKSYMTKKNFQKHKLVLQPYLKKINKYGDPYWQS